MKSLSDRTWFKGLALTVWAFILAALTVFLGAVPLKILKDVCGRRAYWMIGFAVVTGLFFTPWKSFAILFLSLVVLVGLFADLEERDHSVFYAGFCSVLVTGLLGAGAFALWISQFGVGWYAYLLDQVAVLLAPAKQLAGVNVEPAAVLAQTPSGVAILLMLALFVAVVFEDRLRSLMLLPKGVNHQLVWFRVPDVCVWFFILALFGSFAKVSATHPVLQMISLNVLNVMIVLYFFQGLAVVVRTFEVLRVGLFWQVLFFTLVVFQLFLFVSVLGLVDLWANFRARLHRKAPELNNKEENI